MQNKSRLIGPVQWHEISFQMQIQQLPFKLKVNDHSLWRLEIQLNTSENEWKNLIDHQENWKNACFAIGKWNEHFRFFLLSLFFCFTLSESNSAMLFYDFNQLNWRHACDCFTCKKNYYQNFAFSCTHIYKTKYSEEKPHVI